MSAGRLTAQAYSGQGAQAGWHRTHGGSRRKSSGERFEAAVAGIEGLEQRKMFGYPAGFIGGNLTTEPPPGILDRAAR